MTHESENGSMCRLNETWTSLSIEANKSMTWGEFKEMLNREVHDGEQIWFIDVRFPTHSNRYWSISHDRSLGAAIAN